MNTGAKELGSVLWKVACKELRGKMKAGDFQDYMLSFLFLYYISDNYLDFIKKELGRDYTDCEKECEELNNDSDALSAAKERYKKDIAKFIKEEMQIYIKNNPDTSQEAREDEKNRKLKSYEELLAGTVITPLSLWYLKNLSDIKPFESQMKKKAHFVIKPQYLWDNIYKMSLKENGELLRILNSGFRFIEAESFDIAFNGLFSEVNLNSEKLGKDNPQRNITVCSIIKELGNGLLQISTDKTKKNDILGDAYEYLISQFASGSGAKAGEFYTPQSVSNILSEIVTLDSQDSSKQKRTDIKGILDFACGSGSLLINVKKHVNKINEESGSNIKISQIYGQEKNVTTYNLARMNMILHGIKDNEFEIFHGDTLANEWRKFSERNPSKKIECEIVVANPPFSSAWEHTNGIREDFRFVNHGVAPRSTADFAFLLHGLHFLRDNGTMAIILPHGVLFRGGEEENIRKKLINDQNIDAVIGLPANLFYSTGIPVCIIVLKKCKKEDDILFINANKEFTKEKTRNILEDKHIQKIVNAYKERKEEENYSKRVTIDIIKQNDYNLNISRYVSTAEEEKTIDLEQVKDDLDNIEAKITATKEKLNGYLRQLDLSDFK